MYDCDWESGDNINLRNSGSGEFLKIVYYSFYVKKKVKYKSVKKYL